MLDFSKLLDQIDQVGVDSIKDDSDKPTLENALGAFEDAALNPDAFSEDLENSRELVLWPVAGMISPIDSREFILSPAKVVTVIGVDGSQIMPSHHEVHSCYLLNVGLSIFTYGEKKKPVLESMPRLYHRPEDLYPLVDRRRVHIDELYVSLERTVFELEVIASQAEIYSKLGIPVVALYDGSLIPWSVDKMTEGYQESFIDRIETSIKRLKDCSVPLIGYISHSRSSDVVNMLRTFICPYEESRCNEHCGHLNEENFPCSKVWPLTDRALFSQQLDLNQFGPIFHSGAKISQLLDLDCQTCFTYAKFESEVARLEFPKWLAKKPELLRFGISQIMSQVDKGRGYPVVLAEAHHLAVIKAEDRKRFFELITKRLISLGVNRVTLSPKERNKRMGFV